LNNQSKICNIFQKQNDGIVIQGKFQSSALKGKKNIIVDPEIQKILDDCHLELQRL
jgi:hypothetical protein